MNNPIIKILENRSSDDNRPILIGQAPNKNEPGEPLSPDNPSWSGARLARMAGLTADQFRESFFRINILYEPVPSFKVNDITRFEARKLYRSFRVNDRVILLGSAVQKAFAGFLPAMDPIPGQEVILAGNTRNTLYRLNIEYFVIPHPSGVNRIYNDPTNVRIVGEFLRKIVE